MLVDDNARTLRCSECVGREHIITRRERAHCHEPSSMRVATAAEAGAQCGHGTVGSSVCGVAGTSVRGAVGTWVRGVLGGRCARVGW
jgi:hypothetical protein